MLGHILANIENCSIESYLSPTEAIARCAETQFDVVLVDYTMPEMTGVELTRQLRARDSYRLVPVVIVTSHSDRSVRLEAMAAGASDFVNKPFDQIELRARVRNLLALRQSQIELADRALWLAREVEAATRHLIEREEEVIWRLARALEYRDGNTGEHISRMATVCRLIAEGLGIDAARCRTIYLAAPLHDVGKIGISDAILGKAGRLTADEMAQMREHVAIGARILENSTSDLLRVAAIIAQSHHEKWDGTGYPAGAAGEQIPIEGRIAAVADVFDALCSQRPYKPAWPIDKAYAEIVAGSGRHFDPECVRAFQAQWSKIIKVMQVAATEAA
ncbi:MAG: response regulator [Hyphomicrobiales bacterium]|nr:response regulator [Hyphomicrobiales bacterium]